MHPAAGNTYVRYAVLAMLCLAAAIAYISRSCIAVPAELIRVELGLSLDQMGWVMSAFYWSYALGQFPSGWLAHLWGTRRALSFYAFVWSAATACSAGAIGFWSLAGSRLAFGLAQAGIFPCSADTISKWISKSQRGLATGALSSFMSVGGAVGVALTGVLMKGMTLGGWQLPGISWRSLFVLSALPGFLWAAWFFVWFRDHPKDHSKVGLLELEQIQAGSDRPASADSAQPAVPLKDYLFDLSLWMLCGQQFFRAAGYIFYLTWFPTYLQRVRGVTLDNSGLLGSLPLLAVVIGSLMGGIVLDWLWTRTGSARLSRQGLGLLAMFSCAACTLVAYFASDTRVAVLVLCLANFFAALAGASSYTLCIDKGGARVAPIFAIMNMSGNLGAAVCPIVVGKMFDAGLFNGVLILVTCIYVGATACWVFLNPEGSFGKS